MYLHHIVVLTQCLPCSLTVCDWSDFRLDRHQTFLEVDGNSLTTVIHVLGGGVPAVTLCLLVLPVEVAGDVLGDGGGGGRHR